MANGFLEIFYPRLTWQYLAATGLALYTGWHLLLGIPLLSSDLPSYTGKHAVGVIDLETAVETREVNNVVYKQTGKSAFKLETVYFSLYYPASHLAESVSPRHYWLSRPVSLQGIGLAKFAGQDNAIISWLFTFLLWVLAGQNKIPAKPDVPLLDPTDRAQSLNGKWPVIVFSHGDASSRTTYTQYCGELASRGYVVAAIEHRDGSGPGTVLTLPSGIKKHIFRNKAEELLSPDTTKVLDRSEWKRAQLDFRQAEIEEIVKVLRQLGAMRVDTIDESLPSNLGPEGRSISTFASRLDVDNMTIAGHSYGATTALQVLSGGRNQTRPFSGAIILDPGKQSGRLNDDVRVPLLMVHSQTWSKTHSLFFGRPHFEAVKDIVDGINQRGIAAWFMTSLDTSHSSVSDAPLLQPLLLNWSTGATIDVREGLKQYIRVSVDFLKYQHMNGLVTGLLTRPVDEPIFVKPRKMEGQKTEYWQVHVSPPTKSA